MNDSQPNPTDSPTPSTAAPPWRLRVHHFFIWTALAALLLAISQAGSQTDEIRTYRDSQAMLLPLAAIAIGVAVEGFWRRSKYGESFPREPGHGFACLAAAWTASQSVTLLMLQSAERSSASPAAALVLGLSSLGLNVLVLGFCLWFAWRRLPGGPWRWLLTLIGLGPLVMLGASFVAFAMIRAGNMRMLMGMYAIWPLASLALAVLAIVGDRGAGRTRPWHHWAGFAPWFLSTSYTLAMQTVALLMMAV
ncbi:MAG: hypothetical protein CMJ58_20790 [Planctomycetaceae bacterium]|nr:hypothetical protein [Planctomycetaceae bacterium]